MTEKKKKLTQYTSPKGVFVYPNLTTPDTKFKPEGEFHTKLKLGAAQAAALVTMIDKAALASLQAAQETAKTPKDAAKWETKYLPYEVETDDAGEETGDVIFKFSSKASGTTKEGRAWKRTMPLFDSSGKPMPRKGDGYSVDVWSGSEGYVSYSIVPYSPTQQSGASVKLSLDAVQVTKLVSGGSRSATDYGFGQEDGGYQAEEETSEAEAAGINPAPEGDGSSDF